MLAVASALLLAVVPPEPIIISGPAPGAQLTRSTATFTFGVPGRDYLYECKMGGRTAFFGPCTGPRTFTATGLGVGTHTFSVRTADGDDVSATVERTFTVTAIDATGTASRSPRTAATRTRRSTRARPRSRATGSTRTATAATRRCRSRRL